MNDIDVTERFSDRVEDYVRYRPDYPPALLDWLARDHGVTTLMRVADIGAGTGISSKLFLDAGYRVIAVEPNAAMRRAAGQWLGGHAGFSTVDGRAEATTLTDHSVELVITGQAFHWFDQAAAKREFERILGPGGLIAVFWNTRRLTGTPFLEGYEALLLEYGTDYVSVAERYADDEAMATYFGNRYRGHASFEHAQKLDFEQLRGRLLSSSYAPSEGQPMHQPMLLALRRLFDACALDGRIDFEYDTRIFVGEAN